MLAWGDRYEKAPVASQCFFDPFQGRAVFTYFSFSEHDSRCFVGFFSWTPTRRKCPIANLFPKLLQRSWEWERAFFRPYFHSVGDFEMAAFRGCFGHDPDSADRFADAFIPKSTAALSCDHRALLVVSSEWFCNSRDPFRSVCVHGDSGIVRHLPGQLAADRKRTVFVFFTGTNRIAFDLCDNIVFRRCA